LVSAPTGAAAAYAAEAHIFDESKMWAFGIIKTVNKNFSFSCYPVLMVKKEPKNYLRHGGKSLPPGKSGKYHSIQTPKAKPLLASYLTADQRLKREDFAYVLGLLGYKQPDLTADNIFVDYQRKANPERLFDDLSFSLDTQRQELHLFVPNNAAAHQAFDRAMEAFRQQESKNAFIAHFNQTWNNLPDPKGDLAQIARNNIVATLAGLNSIGVAVVLDQQDKQSLGPLWEKAAKTPNPPARPDSPLSLKDTDFQEALNYVIDNPSFCWHTPLRAEASFADMKGCLLGRAWDIFGRQDVKRIYLKAYKLAMATLENPRINKLADRHDKTAQIITNNTIAALVALKALGVDTTASDGKFPLLKPQADLALAAIKQQNFPALLSLSPQQLAQRPDKLSIEDFKEGLDNIADFFWMFSPERICAYLEMGLSTHGQELFRNNRNAFLNDYDTTRQIVGRFVEGKLAKYQTALATLTALISSNMIDQPDAVALGGEGRKKNTPMAAIIGKVLQVVTEKNAKSLAASPPPLPPKKMESLVKKMGF